MGNSGNAGNVGSFVINGQPVQLLPATGAPASSGGGLL
jgi:hypothetical protein